jgi:hypothetical protein
VVTVKAEAFMRKWLLLILFWLIVTPLLLEGLMRLAVPLLPSALQMAAERVYRGESTDINRLNLMVMDIDHNFMMRPNIENELYGSHQTVIFHVSTVQILDSRMGFRTRPFAQGDPVDVAVVGDSFSFCFTEYADCWVTRFEQQTGLATMNLAQGSTGSVSHWRFIDTFGRAFEPPLVIWQWFVNDFNEDYQLAVLRGEMPPSDVETVIPDYSQQVNPIVNWLRNHSVAWVVLEIGLFGEDAYISDFERYHFTRPYEVTYTDPQGTAHALRFGQRYEQIASNIDDPRVASGVPLTRAALAQAQAAVESWGGQMVVVLIPTREEVYEHLTAPVMGAEAVAELGETRRVMNDLCADLGLTCLDTLDSLQESARRGEHLYYTEDMHLNPYGNAVLADVMIAWLRDLGLVETP